jgi:predicted amidophosphoribosyltransferase
MHDLPDLPEPAGPRRFAARPGAIVAELVALIAPPLCPACRSPLGAAPLRLCPGCAAALPWLPRTCCPACGLPRHRGGRCPAAGAAFDRSWAPLAHDGVSRELVAALKFRGALPLAGLMAAHLAANLPADLRPRAGEAPVGTESAAVAPFAARADPLAARAGPLAARAGPFAARADPLAIVPVPPQPSRHRRRGFDPAEALAQALGDRLGIPVQPCLRRRDRARRQVGTSRRERRVAGRLTIEARGAPPARALLLDDVHTTGATLEACARALRAAGCGRVAAVTYTRTL